MDSMWAYQIGLTIAALQAQVSQLNQAIQLHAKELQEKSDLFEMLAAQLGWKWSQDQQRWIGRDASQTIV